MIEKERLLKLVTAAQSGDCYLYGDYNYSAFTTEDGTVAWSAGVNDTTKTDNMWYGTAHPLYLTGDSDMLEEMTVSGLLGIFGEVYLLQDMPD